MMQNPTPSTGKVSTRSSKAAGAVKRDINLLPVNENTERIARGGTVVLAVLGALLVLAAVAIYLPATWLWDLQRKADLAETQVAAKTHFEAEFKQAVTRRDSLQEMLGTLETIEGTTMHPADVIDMLARSCPKNITLTGFTQSADGITVAGRAQADADIAEFIVNLRSQQKVYGVFLAAVRQDADTGAAQLRLFDLTVSLSPPSAPTADPGAAAPTPTTEGGDGK